MPPFGCPTELEMETDSNTTGHSFHSRTPSPKWEPDPSVFRCIASLTLSASSEEKKTEHLPLSSASDSEQPELSPPSPILSPVASKIRRARRSPIKMRCVVGQREQSRARWRLSPSMRRSGRRRRPRGKTASCAGPSLHSVTVSPAPSL
jgi:hypothetical protein